MICDHIMYMDLLKEMCHRKEKKKKRGKKQIKKIERMFFATGFYPNSFTPLFKVFQFFLYIQVPYIFTVPLNFFFSR